MQLISIAPSSVPALLYLLLASCARLASGDSARGQLVPVTIQSQSGCPCTAQFAYDFNKTVWSDAELRSAIALKQPWSASANVDNTTSCYHDHLPFTALRRFHGKRECRFEKWLLCSQQQGMDKAFRWELCVNGPCTGHPKRLPMMPCKTQYVNPDNATLLRACAAEQGMDFDALKSCATSYQGSALLLDDARTLRRRYFFEGLPVVEVNGKVLSAYADCSVKMDKVLSAICDAITNRSKPKACQSPAPAAFVPLQSPGHSHADDVHMGIVV